MKTETGRWHQAFVRSETRESTFLKETGETRVTAGMLCEQTFGGRAGFLLLKPE